MTSTTSQTPPSRAASVAASPKDMPSGIFDAALECFAEKGFHGASMRLIATAANTSLSNLYNYYPSKSDLFFAVLKRANDKLLRRVEGTIASARATPTERLRAGVRAYVAFAVEDPQAATVALSEFRYLEGELWEQLRGERGKTQAHFLDIIEEGVATGEFATTRVHESARAILLLCATIANWYRPDGARSPEAIAEIQADFALLLVEAR